MAVTLKGVQGRKEKEDCNRNDAAVRIDLEKEKRETEDNKRVKRTFRFYLFRGRSKMLHVICEHVRSFVRSATPSPTCRLLVNLVYKNINFF